MPRVRSLSILDLGLIRRFHDRPIAGYVVRTSDLVILVDTGPPRFRCATPPLVATPAQSLEAQLGVLELSPADIGMVICTHLDPDHAGNLDLFHGTSVVVQQTHLDLARAGEVDRLDWVKDQWSDPMVCWETVNGDVEIVPGVAVVETPGHIRGHQSVVVSLPSGPVILAGDAITRSEALDAASRPMTAFDLDHEQARASTQKLQEIAERTGAWIVRGHDPEQWRELRLAPDIYT